MFKMYCQKSTKFLFSKHSHIPCITAQKVKLLSSVGPTERSFLANIEDIVNSALPVDKLVSYITIPAAENYLLKKIGFCEEIMKVR